MVINISLEALLIKFLIFVLSAIPLYFAVSLIRKKVSFLKVLLVTFVAAIVMTAIESYFGLLGLIIGFIILLWLYREIFRLKWLNALLVWILQVLFIIMFKILFWLLDAFFGISVPRVW